MSDQEEKQATEETTDNLVDVLDEFNSGEEVKAEEVQDKEQGSDESKEPESVGEGKTETERQEAIQWLIDNKFKDDDKGKQDLAHAYKELQSKTDKERAETDKERAEFTQQAQKYEQLDKLDGYLRDNPDVVKQLSERVKMDVDKPPPKPEEYDILDEQIEGSDSAKWREQNDQWLVNRGAQIAKDEIGQFKAEIQAKEQRESEINELKDLGLDESDIESFNTFMTDNSNLTTPNLVKIWKFLSQHKDGNSQKAAGRKEETTAAASPGKAPVTDVDPSSKEVDTFWDGIMDNSRKV
jgi:hypothetical protein